jgi:HK97 family phage major capsid protein
MWPKIANAIGRVQSTRFTGPTAIVMRPNMWAWLVSVLGSDGRPLITSGNAGPTNALGVQTGTDYGQAVGELQGIPVVLDGNIPTNLGAGTNETAVIVGDFRDALLFEDPQGAPVQLRFDDVGSSNMTSRLVAYGYSAFTAGRKPGGFAKITGTGMIPTVL